MKETKTASINAIKREEEINFIRIRIYTPHQ